MFAKQIARPTGLVAGPRTTVNRVHPATLLVKPMPRKATVARAEKFERDDKPPPENLSNAAKEISRETSKAGAQEADNNPRGGSGLEPPPADGEGQGYSMVDIAKQNNTGGGAYMESSDGDTSSGTSSSSSSESDEAGVQEVE